MSKPEAYRSPFFYVGDKYKLVPQLTGFFPDNISMYIDIILQTLIQGRGKIEKCAFAV